MKSLRSNSFVRIVAKLKLYQRRLALTSCDTIFMQGLAKAVHKKDILAVLQVFAEGVDLSAPLHDLVSRQVMLFLAVLLLKYAVFLMCICADRNTTRLPTVVKCEAYRTPLFLF